MKLLEVSLMLQGIEECAGDPEIAHIEQDIMFLEVLKAISEDASNAKELAAAALKVTDIDFPRWHA